MLCCWNLGGTLKKNPFVLNKKQQQSFEDKDLKL